MPRLYTVHYKTKEGWGGRSDLYAKSSSHAISSAKELWPDIHRITGVTQTPQWS